MNECNGIGDLEQKQMQVWIKNKSSTCNKIHRTANGNVY